MCESSFVLPKQSVLNILVEFTYATQVTAATSLKLDLGQSRGCSLTDRSDRRQ